jgi:hypothetical protein
MESPLHGPSKISLSRLAILFCLFLLITMGLGYPILNRYNPRNTPGLSDVRSYASLVTGENFVGPSHLRFRVFLPWIAKFFYRLADGRLGSWDPVMFGLLCSDSLFAAATALLIVMLGTRQFGNYPVALVGALLYLLNFAVPNLRLAGLVDAGEGFFLLTLLWSLSEREFRLLPVIAVCGALTKESFVPLSFAFTAGWWIFARKEMTLRWPTLFWIISSLVGLLAIFGTQWRVSGNLESPIAFAAALHGNRDYLHHLASSLLDRNLWYIFVWLLPASLPHLGRLPKTWLVATAAAVTMTFILDGYYGGAPGTLGRELFSVAGPVLSLSAASFLCNRAPLAVG